MLTPTKEKPLAFSEPMMREYLADRKTMTRRVVRGIDHAAVTDAEPHFRNDDLDGIAWDFKREWQPLAGIFVDRSVTVKPPYLPGSTVWIRETWRVVAMQLGTHRVRVQYKADMTVSDWLTVPDRDMFFSLYKQTEKEALRQGHLMNTWDRQNAPTRWRPGRYMPRCLSRESAVVVDVQAERVTDITEADAVREGFHSGRCAPERCAPCVYGTACPGQHAAEAFAELWDNLNAHRDPAYSWNASPWVWRIQFERAKGAGA